MIHSNKCLMCDEWKKAAKDNLDFAESLQKDLKLANERTKEALETASRCLELLDLLEFASHQESKPNGN